MRKRIVFLIVVVFAVVNTTTHSNLRENDNQADRVELTEKSSLAEGLNTDGNKAEHEPLESGDKLEVPAVPPNLEEDSEHETALLKIGDVEKKRKNNADHVYLQEEEESQIHERVIRHAKWKICIGGCVNSKCEGLGVCKCYPGFHKSDKEDNVCVPTCRRPCQNGNCTSPESCTCREDYELTADKYVCKPKCYSWCNPGQCHQPYECTCTRGFVLQSANCRPAICQKACPEFEFCAADNFCDCLEGYQRTGGSYPYTMSKCEPVCHRLCPTGRCGTPNHCICNTGYRWNARIAKCEPVCQTPCVNGFTCDAPNHCGCQNGSVKNKTVQGIYGSTVEPECIHRDSGSALISSILLVLAGIVFAIRH